MKYEHPNKVFTIRMEPALRTKLEQLSKSEKISMAEVVRRLVLSQ